MESLVLAYHFTRVHKYLFILIHAQGFYVSPFFSVINGLIIRKYTTLYYMVILYYLYIAMKSYNTNQ